MPANHLAASIHYDKRQSTYYEGMQITAIMGVLFNSITIAAYITMSRYDMLMTVMDCWKQTQQMSMSLGFGPMMPPPSHTSLLMHEVQKSDA